MVDGDGGAHEIIGGHGADGALGAGGHGGAQLGGDVDAVVGAPVAHGVVVGEDFETKISVDFALDGPDIAGGGGGTGGDAFLLGRRCRRRFALVRFGIGLVRFAVLPLGGGGGALVSLVGGGWLLVRGLGQLRLTADHGAVPKALRLGG